MHCADIVRTKRGSRGLLMPKATKSLRWESGEVLSERTWRGVQARRSVSVGARRARALWNFGMQLRKRMPRRGGRARFLSPLWWATVRQRRNQQMRLLLAFWDRSLPSPKVWGCGPWNKPRICDASFHEARGVRRRSRTGEKVVLD